MMAKFNLVLIFCIGSILNGQFISNLPSQSLPSKHDDQYANYPIFSKGLNRFNINHGFTMSMITDGKTSYSVSGINNTFSYSVLNNLSFNGSIGLYMVQSPIQKQNLMLDQLTMAYDASVTYKPTENSFLQFRLQKLPHHQSYSPFNIRFKQ